MRGHLLLTRLQVFDKRSLMNVSCRNAWQFMVHEERDIHFIEASSFGKCSIAVTQNMWRWQTALVFFWLGDVT